MYIRYIVEKCIYRYIHVSVYMYTSEGLRTSAPTKDYISAYIGIYRYRCIQKYRRMRGVCCIHIYAHRAFTDIHTYRYLYRYIHKYRRMRGVCCIHIYAHRAFEVCGKILAEKKIKKR